MSDAEYPAMCAGFDCRKHPAHPYLRKIKRSDPMFDHMHEVACLRFAVNGLGHVFCAAAEWAEGEDGKP